MTVDWRERYAGMAEWVLTGAPAAAPLLAGFNTCVDQIYRLGPESLDALVAAADDPAVGEFAREVLDRIAAGRDGELFVPDRDQVEPWLLGWLGEPAAAQVGGTGAQACWSLAVLGAPTVLALADRSRAQLGVLHPDIGVCVPGAVTSIGWLNPPADLSPTKPPHYILEFTAGTRWSGGTVPRSSRIIVRVAEDGIERDADFAGVELVRGVAAGAGLVSGLNGVPEDDAASRAWLRGVVAGWQAAGLAMIHLEAAEYVRPGALNRAIAGYAGLVTSLGLSLTELRALGTSTPDPAEAARELATRLRLRRVCVHADTWSMVVHRGDPAPEITALTVGNLLAAARARHGVPTNDLSVAPTATFADDLPPGARLGDGWRAECVPTPHLSRPAATIGLGDTFVAGLLLANCLPARPATGFAPAERGAAATHLS
jgi:ADP-dependent phosphofructokinase/glucokinase